MNYTMIQRELKTLSEDLGQLGENITGPEPPEPKHGSPGLPHRVMLPDEVRRQLEYILTKLKAVIDLTRESKPIIPGREG